MIISNLFFILNEPGIQLRRDMTNVDHPNLTKLNKSF